MSWQLAHRSGFQCGFSAFACSVVGGAARESKAMQIIAAMPIAH
jgi:hypothetical protein